MLNSSQLNISNVLGGVCHQGRSMPLVDGSLLRFFKSRKSLDQKEDYLLKLVEVVQGACTQV